MSAGIPAGGPFKAAVGLHEALSLEHLREVRRLLSSYCLAGEGYCREALRLVREAARLIARARLEDLVDDDKYQGLDAPLLALIRRLRDVYEAYLSGTMALAGENPVVYFKWSASIEGVPYEDGDIAIVKPSTAFKAVACGAAEPLEGLLPGLHALQERLKAPSRGA